MHAASLPRFRPDHRRWLLIAAAATIVVLCVLLAVAGITGEIGPSQPAEELLGPFRWRPAEPVA